VTATGISLPDAPPAAAAAPARPWRPTVTVGLTYWVLANAFLTSVQFVAWAVNRPGAAGCRWDHATHGTWSGLIYNQIRWDACDYAQLAMSGYPSDPHQAALYTAWPPVFPLAIRGLGYLTPGGVPVAGLVLSKLAALALLIVLARFVATELDDRLVRPTLLALIAFPTAFFLLTGYSESLYLLLCVGALYLARRGRWWWAGLLGGLASGTRVVGVFLVLALAYEYLRQRDFSWRRIRLDVVSLGLVPAGLGLYALFLWRTYGDPMLFMKAQAQWERQWALPWSGLKRALVNSHPGASPQLAFRNLFDVAVVLAILALLALAVVGPWRLPRDQTYLVIFGAMPFVSALLQPELVDAEPLASMTRFTIAAVPAFLVLAAMLRHRLAMHAYLYIALPLQAGLVLLYLAGEWVA
jgi:hypothetical protein